MLGWVRPRAVAALVSGLAVIVQTGCMVRDRASLADNLRDQLARCYTSPEGAPDVKVVVRVRLKPDGSLFEKPQVLKGKGSPGFAEAARAAFRAVDGCTPLRIPPAFTSEYDVWKELIVEFDPNP